MLIKGMTYAFRGKKNGIKILKSVCYIYTMSQAVTVARYVARRAGFSNFCLRIQVLLSLATFSPGLSRYP